MVRQTQRSHLQQDNRRSIIEIEGPKIEEVYDNDISVLMHENAYSDVPLKRSNSTPNKSIKQVANRQESFYEDPFETGVSVRRDSNPNIYQTATKMDGNPEVVKSNKAMGVVLTNPAVDDEESGATYLEITNTQLKQPSETVISNPTFKPEDDHDEYIEVSGMTAESTHVVKPPKNWFDRPADSASTVNSDLENKAHKYVNVLGVTAVSADSMKPPKTLPNQPTDSTFTVTLDLENEAHEYVDVSAPAMKPPKSVSNQPVDSASAVTFDPENEADEYVDVSGLNDDSARAMKPPKSASSASTVTFDLENEADEYVDVSDTVPMKLSKPVSPVQVAESGAADQAALSKEAPAQDPHHQLAGGEDRKSSSPIAGAEFPTLEPLGGLGDYFIFGSHYDKINSTECAAGIHSVGSDEGQDSS